MTNALIETQSISFEAPGSIVLGTESNVTGAENLDKWFQSVTSDVDYNTGGVQKKKFSINEVNAGTKAPINEKHLLGRCLRKNDNPFAKSGTSPQRVEAQMSSVNAFIDYVNICEDPNTDSTVYEHSDEFIENIGIVSASDDADGYDTTKEFINNHPDVFFRNKALYEQTTYIRNTYSARVRHTITHVCPRKLYMKCFTLEDNSLRGVHRQFQRLAFEGPLLLNQSKHIVRLRTYCRKIGITPLAVVVDDIGNDNTNNARTYMASGKCSNEKSQPAGVYPVEASSIQPATWSITSVIRERQIRGRGMASRRYSIMFHGAETVDLEISTRASEDELSLDRKLVCVKTTILCDARSVWAQKNSNLKVSTSSGHLTG